MRESLVGAIWRAYRDPRAAMARQLSAGPSEPQALFHLLLACGLFFVASLPDALRKAPGLGIEDGTAAAVAAHLFAFGALAPLLFYALAALLHLAARAFGGHGGFPAARAALFWAALLGAPLALALALVGVGAELAGGRLAEIAGWGIYAGFAFWLWLLAASFAEAEGFPGTGRVAAVMAAGFAVFAGALGLLAGGGAAAA